MGSGVMANRDDIARKLIEQAEMTPPLPPPVMRTTERKYPIWQGLPANASATAHYNPYAAFHPSENIEDRRGEIGGARRALGIREGIDREPAFVMPYTDRAYHRTNYHARRGSTR